ncbi:unnamed protein product [Nezara viridula]|uniref:Uncharacterized protein n=1 Tax=Nezara viridula TaxID=85310 RepID=A0A9P0HBW1_NEZVI|nr:unnamed protein product [Nezara viridula]
MSKAPWVKAQYKVQAAEQIEKKQERKLKSTTITVKDTEPETLNTQ